MPAAGPRSPQALRCEGGELFHGHWESTAATDRRRRSVPCIRIGAGEMPGWTAPGVPGRVLAANTAVWRAARKAIQASRRTRARSGELRGAAQQLVIAVKRARADRWNGATEAQLRNPVV